VKTAEESFRKKFTASRVVKTTNEKLLADKLLPKKIFFESSLQPFSRLFLQAISKVEGFGFKGLGFKGLGVYRLLLVRLQLIQNFDWRDPASNAIEPSICFPTHYVMLKWP